MPMLASGPLLGLALGWIFGGDPRRLGELRIRWWPLLAVAVLLRLAASAAPAMAPLLYVMAFGAVALVAFANARLPGMPLIGAGAALNLLVVALNGGMPVDPVALAAVGVRMPTDALHLELTRSAPLALLADVIPLPPVRGVYSLGDVLLAIGGAWLPFVRMRRR